MSEPQEKKSAKEPQPAPLRAIDLIRRSSRDTRRKLVVPEWDGLELYFHKVTPADLEAVEETEPKGVWERHLRLLVRKAQLEDGSPAFADGDVYYLLHETELIVLQRVVNFTYESVYATVEDAKEAISRDPT